MEKTLPIILIIGILMVVGGIFICRILTKESAPAPAGLEEKFMPSMQGKKIAMVIAFRDFRDEEYFIPRQILEAAGAKIETFSDSLGKAIGASGGEAEVNGLIENLGPRNYDAVLFIGGSGAADFIDNPVCHKIARETIEAGKTLGAICVAPAILAKAGVLSGKKATVWSSALDKSMVKILKDAGAVYQPSPVVADGKIITASGPDFAEEFGLKIIEAISKL